MATMKNSIQRVRHPDWGFLCWRARHKSGRVTHETTLDKARAWLGRGGRYLYECITDDGRLLNG